MEQLTDLLRELADKLGTTVDHLYQVMITQAKVEIISNSIFLIIIIAWLVLFKKIYKYLYAKKIERDKEIYGWDENGWFWALIGHAVLTVILVIIGLLEIDILLTLIINPEYWALDKILTFISH